MAYVKSTRVSPTTHTHTPMKFSLLVVGAVPDRYESIDILPGVGDEVDDMVCPNTIRLTEAVSSKWTIKRCLADFTWIGVGREPPEVLVIKKYGN